jgi:formate hydrogenlyase subunit 3/multisubunit Na+/H+ antiporter MnhD subunit
MIKAGLLGWLRFLPVDLELVLPGWGTIFIVLGVLAAFYGVFLGLVQQDPKTILAYSSISQMGLMTMLVGCGLHSPAFWPQVKNAVSIYALHHGLAKAALFLGTGLAKAGGRQNPPSWLVILLLLPALALAGLPLTSGAIAKFNIKEIVNGLPLPWGTALKLILPLTTLTTTLLVGHFLRTFSPTGPDSKPPIRTGMLVPWIILLMAVGVFLWLWPAYPEYARHITDFELHWQNLYPVVLGSGMLFFFWKMFPGKIILRLPAGDILWLVYGPSKKDRDLPAERSSDGEGGINTLRWQTEKYQLMHNSGRGIEKKFRRWGVVGTCYIFLFFIFLFVLFMK